MRYLSLFSGIEAASVAWGPLGWECVGFSEIEPFPTRLLAARHPGVPNLGDVTKITEADIAMLGHIDLIVFGSPCQDLSVAGKQKGLTGERSGLFFAAMRIIGWAREWCDLRGALWENVPGAFSSNKGADFAAVVGALAGLECSVPPKGWGTEGCAVGSEAMVEWSVLDAQWFGVPQRRRRVFALADFGDWSRRPPVLLEPESLRGDTAPRRQAREDVAGTIAASTEGGGHDVVGTLDASYARLQGCSGQDLNHGHSHLLAFGGNNTSGPIDVSTALNACGTASGRMDFESETFVTCFSCKDHGADASVDVAPTMRAMGHSGSHANAGGQLEVCVTGHVTHALTGNGFDASEDGTGRGNPIIAFNSNARPAVAYGFDILGTPASEVAKHTDVHTPLRARVPGQLENSTVTMVMQASRVRRLTPLECERLMGFPDHYTAIPGAADGPRYKALGNSMAVPVMNWIGRQIDYAWSYF